MYHEADIVAVSEMMEMHVRQQPTPHGVPIPADIRARLDAALCTEQQRAKLPVRARALQL